MELVGGTPNRAHYTPCFFFSLYAPVDYANPAERRAMQTKLLEPILKCLEGFTNGK